MLLALRWHRQTQVSRSGRRLTNPAKRPVRGLPRRGFNATTPTISRPGYEVDRYRRRTSRIWPAALGMFSCHSLSCAMGKRYEAELIVPPERRRHHPWQRREWSNPPQRRGQRIPLPSPPSSMPAPSSTQFTAISSRFDNDVRQLFRRALQDRAHQSSSHYPHRSAAESLPASPEFTTLHLLRAQAPKQDRLQTTTRPVPSLGSPDRD